MSFLNKNVNSSYRSLFLGAFLGLLLGILVPFIFIILDLKELSMEFNSKNLEWIMSGQMIMKLSLVLLPVLFSILGIAIALFKKKNEELTILHATTDESLNYIETLFHTISDSIFVVNQNGQIVKANHAGEKLKDSVQIDYLHDIFEDSKKLTWFEFQKKYLPHNTYNIELTVRPSACPVLLSAVYLEKGGKKEIICTIKDITKLKELQIEIENQMAQNAANSRLASLGEMAAGIAHEINNPLAIILLNSESIAKHVEKNRGEIDPDILLKKCQNIKDTVERTNKIVTSMRELSRDTSKEMLEEHTFQEVLQSTVPLIQDKIKFNSIDFQIENTNKCLDIKVRFKKIQISQILINLLQNSIDAICELKEKRITIFAEIYQDQYFLYVQDSGNGISKDIAEKIFSPFYTSKAVGKGTGLGLSISNNIMKQHHGSIEVDHSRPNTTFVLKFPLA